MWNPLIDLHPQKRKEKRQSQEDRNQKSNDFIHQWDPYEILKFTMMEQLAPMMIENKDQ